MVFVVVFTPKDSRTERLDVRKFRSMVAALEAGVALVQTGKATRFHVKRLDK